MTEEKQLSSDIVTDTSVLINFLAIDRMDLFAKYSKRFYAPAAVRKEITGKYPVQFARLNSAILIGVIAIHPTASPNELPKGEKVPLWGSLGLGERAAIALATKKASSLAIDDAKAISYMDAVGKKHLVLRTQDLMVAMIKENLLDVAEADEIKDQWKRKYRFAIEQKSFQELL